AGDGDAGTIVAGCRRREGGYGGALAGVGKLRNVSRTLACKFRRLAIHHRNLERVGAPVPLEPRGGGTELSARGIDRRASHSGNPLREHRAGGGTARK